MRGGQRGHVEHLAIGGQPAVKIVAIPGGQPLRAIVGVLFGNVDPASDGIGFADAVGTAALWHGVTKRHHARAAGNAVFGVNAAGKFTRGRAIAEDEARRHGRNAARCP
jgi:hypothetical protein